MRLSLPALAVSFALTAPLAQAQSDDRASMLSWINAARAAEGIGALAGDARLDAVADAHARDMATQGFFSHTSPTTQGPGERAAAANIDFRHLAENIAMNQHARAAHEALLRSPGHRANLLSPNLRRVGLGFARGPQGLYVTQLFATLPQDESTPAPAPLRVPVVPQVPAIPAAPPAEAVVPTPPVAPAAPVPPAETAAPETPAEITTPDAWTAALPQVINALPNVFDPRRWGQILPTAPRRPRAPATPARGASTWSVPTPFGALRVAVPPGLAAQVPAEVSLDWDDNDTTPGCARAPNAR
jgi:hypothetical protein